MKTLGSGATLGFVLACLIGRAVGAGDLFVTKEYVAFGRLQQVDAKGVTLTEGCAEGSKPLTIAWAALHSVTFASLCDHARDAAPPMGDVTKKPCAGKPVELFTLFTWPGGNRPQYEAYATDVHVQGKALKLTLANHKGQATLDRDELERGRFALKRGIVCDTEVTDPVLPPHSIRQ